MVHEIGIDRLLNCFELLLIQFQGSKVDIDLVGQECVEQSIERSRDRIQFPLSVSR